MPQPEGGYADRQDTEFLNHTICTNLTKPATGGTELEAAAPTALLACFSLSSSSSSGRASSQSRIWSLSRPEQPGSLHLRPVSLKPTCEEGGSATGTCKRGTVRGEINKISGQGSRLTLEASVASEVLHAGNEQQCLPSVMLHVYA